MNGNSRTQLNAIAAFCAGSVVTKVLDASKLAATDGLALLVVIVAGWFLLDHIHSTLELVRKSARVGVYVAMCRGFGRLLGEVIGDLPNEGKPKILAKFSLRNLVGPLPACEYRDIDEAMEMRFRYPSLGALEEWMVFMDSIRTAGVTEELTPSELKDIMAPAVNRCLELCDALEKEDERVRARGTLRAKFGLSP